MSEATLIIGGRDEKQRVPVFSALIQSAGKNILIDTGLNPLGIKDPEAAWGKRCRVIDFEMREEDSITNRLEQIGISKIDAVINTHLHWDHCGGNLCFPKAEFFVQKAEYRFALYPDSIRRGGYILTEFYTGLKFNLLEGDQKIFPGVAVLATPGHTPGHQSVIVRLPGKTFILAADAIYTKRNLDRGLPPGESVNASLAVASINKLGFLANWEGAEILFGHDAETWEKLCKSPLPIT